MTGIDEQYVLSTDTRRAEAFSDGVLAIVITLLVLDLRTPSVPPGHLLEGLLAQWPAYLAYVTSYIYVAVVWLNHKAAFKRVVHVDRGLHWANLGVLFTTALLPFPTAVLSRTVLEENPTDIRTAVALYALVGALVCAAWLALFQHLSTHPILLAEGVEAEFFAKERIRAWAGIALYIVAGIIGALIAPPIALAIFLAVPAFYGLTSSGLYSMPAVARAVDDDSGER
ncbi:TMEM175 family protein [Planosporangium mesophilum]|uniref:DUF1211 domain-containing protein n=1 Tax=Planosporangium mesophilum TaxID=689768 RepID=A0A8J3X0X3_9ACTN|nr:TMEM175 family protein [Planosporangium mesophilum]NJC82709.1 DUF1211 domain-containing protein [Planosporangium mesophilum]GII23825.1 hypothetical protein Pme01_34220 [Planosporangium mesophilum]